MSAPLCIGDTVCIYATEALGYVYSLQSSSVYSELAVQRKVKKENPGVPHLQAISFEICMPGRYKLNKTYRKVKEKIDTVKDISGELFSLLHEAKRNADAENEANEHEQKKSIGIPVYYGQVIQLRHVYTQKYIHVNTKHMAKQEMTELRIELGTHHAKHAYFKIMPRYKVKAEGDLIQLGDQVVFESVKSIAQYLHVSKLQFGKASVYNGSLELNLSTNSTSFAIERRYKPDSSHIDFVNSGTIICLFHKEFEAYLCAEGLYNYRYVEDVHLRVRELDYAKPRTVFSTTSAINYWQVELQHNLVTGEVIRWDQPFLLKHVLTRKYLNIDAKSKTIKLVEDRSHPSNVFRFHPVVYGSLYVVEDIFCRIEHVISGTWLHAQNLLLPRRSDNDNSGSFKLSWTTGVMKKLGVSPEMQFADAFSVKVVNSCDVHNLFYVLGSVPFLERLVKDSKSKQYMDAKEAHSVMQALTELKTFMVLEGEPVKNRQKLLRNVMVIELLVDILKAKSTSLGPHMIQVYSEIFQVLQTYLLGQSRKNELYVAKYLDFFQEQIKLKGDIGLNAVHMVTELIRDNRKIIDRITQSHIEMFVQLLDTEMNYRFLELLEVLCVCDGVAMSENQKAITSTWLLKKKSVYHTALGEEIGLEKHIVYVSWDHTSNWSVLQEFAQKTGDEATERRAFLESQLQLFGKLCEGRNEFCINVITEELNYLTWEEAFICLTDDTLPDALRAKYCELIIDSEIVGVRLHHRFLPNPYTHSIGNA